MAIRMSTGLKNYLMGANSLLDAFAYGVVHIYSGEQPASADDEPSGDLLARVTNDGAPFTPGNTTGGLLWWHVPNYTMLVVNPAQTWVVTPLTNGTAGWWRFKANAPPDLDQHSNELIRMDGAVKAPFNEMFLVDTNLAVGQPQELTMFQVSFAN